MFNVSERTARNYLNELVKKDLIKPVGPQKGRYYILTQSVAEKLPRNMISNTYE